MRQLLIVSPHFPPVNAPDMHRVRMSLSHFAECGWTPHVLAVRPEAQDAPLDPSLMDLLPEGLSVIRTQALPLAATRPLGIGNVGLRAWLPLYAAGARLIRQQRIDLVYFSTTVFTTLPLGRVWKRRFGVPYVIDLQDPWFSTYYDDRPRAEHPPKYAFARRLHRALEPWTMRQVDGLISVSEGYLDTLRARYPRLADVPSLVIPFGASERDVEAATNHVGPSPGDEVRGVYVGRCGPAMATAVRIVCRALAQGAHDERLSRVLLSFIGTDYAPPGKAVPSVAPIAAEERVAARVSETTDRIGYLDAIRTMVSSRFVLLLGSDDPHYNASKVATLLLTRRPVVAVVHARSPLLDLVRRSGAGIVVTFDDSDDIDGPASRLRTEWGALLTRTTGVTQPDRAVIAPYLAGELTRRQCRVFDAVLEPRAAVVPSCAG